MLQRYQRQNFVYWQGLEALLWCLHQASFSFKGGVEWLFARTKESNITIEISLLVQKPLFVSVFPLLVCVGRLA